MRIWTGVLIAFLAAAFAVPASAVTSHISKTVAEIQPPQVGHDCVYFRLNGVTAADPPLGTTPYFALPRTHVGFKEIYALLLTAYLSSTPVSAQTTGAVAGGECGGYPGLAWLITP